MSSVAAYNANDPYEQLIAQMVAIERQPQFELKAERGDQEIFKGVLSDFDSTLSALHTALEELTDVFTNPFAARKANVPENAGYSVSVTDDVAAGSHTLAVDRLAATDTRVGRRLSADSTSLAGFFDTFGEQSFEIEVFSPTDDEPERRVAIAVSVDAAANDDDSVLETIRAAINEAMSAAVSDGTINAEDAAAASVVNETSDTSRLTLRSGGSGYESRLTFSDSADGLLNFLQLGRPALASTTEDVNQSAFAAGTGGSEIEAPLTLTAANNTLDLTVNGVAQSVQIAEGVYATADDLAAALGTALGGDLAVRAVDGALRIATTGTGSAASLQLTGGTALADLGFEVMDAAATGSDAQTLSVSTDASGGQIIDVGTDDASSALNARFQLDGLTLYRSSNEVNDALDGVTLSLSDTGEASTFTVDSDTKAISGKVEGFIKKYNAVLNYIAKKSKIDPDAGTRGDFAGDSTIRGLRFGMRTDLLQTVEGQPEGLGRLADLGIELNDDGTLKLADEDALRRAVERDSDAVQNLFAAEEGGLAMRLTERLDMFLGTDGIIKNREKSADTRIKRLDARIERWDVRLEKREEQLRLQYARFQETIAVLQGQSAALNQFFYGGYY
jgi:flagellar hook-associated protein 2